MPIETRWMSQLVIRTLRALLVMLALGGLGAQTVIVFVVATHPETDLVDRVVAYSALGVAAIACVEVAFVAIWVLLSMVRRGAIFDERAFRWVDVVTVTGFVAAVLIAALCAHVGEIDDAPGLILIGGGVGGGGGAGAQPVGVLPGL